MVPEGVFMALGKAELGKVYCQWALDVCRKAEVGDAFFVGDVTGSDWEYPYSLVYTHYKNWQGARSQLGIILAGFIPKINDEFGLGLKIRKVARHGHDCTQYYFDLPDEDKPISKLKAIQLLRFLKANPEIVEDPLKFLTYSEGAAAVDWHRRPMQWALGYIQTAIKDLELPPIQMLFVRQDTREPGNSYDWPTFGWTDRQGMLATRLKVAQHVWEWDTVIDYVDKMHT